MVGPEAEQAGIIRAGAHWVEAMATARVPKIVLTVNHASGAGYYAMAGQGFDPDFIFTWPTGRMGVMEGESAVQAVHGPALARRPSGQAARCSSAVDGGRRRDARGIRDAARCALCGGSRDSSMRSSIRRRPGRSWPWRFARPRAIPARTWGRSCSPSRDAGARRAHCRTEAPDSVHASSASRVGKGSGAIGSRRRAVRSRVDRSTTS